MSHGSTATGARHLRTIFAVGAAGILTDGQLLERFATRDGDRAELAFAALVERHGSMVLRVARGVSIDEHSAHDVFQATFLILARKARSLWVRDSLGPWLHGVAYRVASQARSREIRRKSREKDASRPESFEPHDADRADLIRAIHDEIDRLPQPFRLAVVACHLEGLTQQDAADRLGWPVGTLQSRLARGRQKLRSRLERRGLNPSLAILAVPRASVPPLLTSATAKAAVSLNLGKAITGMIAPTVLAMIQTTTKGMLMTKLKLGAAATLMALGGIVGTGMATGVGRPIQATDEPKPASTAVAPRLHLPPMTGSKTDEPIPLPQEGSSETTLLYFHNNDPELNQTMKPVLESLLHNGYTVKSIDLQRFPSYREKFKVESVPSYVLLVGGTPFRQSEGVKTASQLAEFYNDVFGLKEEAKSSVPKPSGVLNQAPNDEPGSIVSESNPKPWETVVRIKLRTAEPSGKVITGVVIKSSPTSAYVLTSVNELRISHLVGAARAIRESSLKWIAVDLSKGKISVDIFDGKLIGWAPGRVGCLNRDMPAKFIGCDFAADLALLKIETKTQLPVSRLVKAGWKPGEGTQMISLGCSDGDDATACKTSLLDSEIPLSSNHGATVVMKCQDFPRPGRTGGGLFTVDGSLAGICTYADPAGQSGFYATPEVIRKFLIDQGLRELSVSDDSDPLKPKSAAANPLIDSKLYKPKPGAPQVLGLPSDAAEPIPTDPKFSDQSRIDDLEKKLDQVLKALEDLKGKANPE